jgi:hypothetical protein
VLNLRSTEEAWAFMVAYSNSEEFGKMLW